MFDGLKSYGGKMFSFLRAVSGFTLAYVLVTQPDGVSSNRKSWKRCKSMCRVNVDFKSDIVELTQ